MEEIRFVVLCLLAWLAPLQTVRAQDAAVAAPHFNVQSYIIQCDKLVFPNAPAPMLSGYAGTNVSLGRIVDAASETLFEFQKCGYSNTDVSIAQELITNGVVTMHVFRGAFPQVFISGETLFRPGEIGVPPVISTASPTTTNVSPAATRTAAAPATNAVRHFVVRGYQVTGNTLLPDDLLDAVFSKHTGTNVTIDDIQASRKELQEEYRDRGYATVTPTLPQQTLTNGIVKIRVFEGRLVEILVTKNRFFSSNNVMRAFPSLRTNAILNSSLFQAELDRANANRDRQIYPEIRPGPEPDTSSLVLGVKDQLPLHAKVEINNQNSPGTPDLRINSSAEYDNLWQHEQSLGVQYSFSPEVDKQGNQWNFYDQPLVANYSAFYRLPLGNPQSVADQVTSQPGSFGYDEATRKFRIPPPSGQTELTIYGSRSTIDTGLQTTPETILSQLPTITITQSTNHQDVTVNEALGFRLTAPLQEFEGVRSTVSGGLDYKTYNIVSEQGNILGLYPTFGVPTHQLLSVVQSQESVQYLPLTIRWDATRQDPLGRSDFGFGYTANFLGDFWPNNRTDFQNVAGSTHATGYYEILTASLARDQILYKDWRLAVKADGQWASQPLISNEQFGDGGVAGVRGYQEGEVFGDTGWRITGELKTPPHVVGLVGGPGRPLTVSASAFMDYGDTYLLDPQGRDGSTPLWGTGAGFVGTVGPHWEGRFIFGVPLLQTVTTTPDQPRFTFSLSGQF
jgi:hemolysin activation/secretion protein